MIARLNLASDPFRNRALPWTVAAAVSAVSLLALVYVLSEYRRVSAETALADRQVRELNARRADLERQANEIKQSIPPEQQGTLRAAHALVDRKSFSWTRLLADLEEALPSSVRVSRINVRDVSRAGDLTRADLDLTVVGRAPTDVTGMITEMNRAGTFTATPVSENQRSGRGESGYEWVLRVTYAQRSRAARPAEEGGREAGAARDTSTSAGGLE